MGFTDRLYAVKNSETGQFFTHRGKFLWHKPGFAKNAWLAQQNWRQRPKHFDDQAVWTVVPMNIVEAPV